MATRAGKPFYGGLELGLCCLFAGEGSPKFRSATATRMAALPEARRLEALSELCLANAKSLLASFELLEALSITAFRIQSGIFPLHTHPKLGYSLESLPGFQKIEALMKSVKKKGRKLSLRLSLHPDQFVVLDSPRKEVLDFSLKELESQALLAKMTGATEINIHAGGVYGDKKSALARLKKSFKLLPAQARERLTIENDDVSFAPDELIPLCEELGVPFVYDIHHHRCNRGSFGIEEASAACARSWKSLKRLPPHMHISSPKDGWSSRNPRPHADYIDPADFPKEWLAFEKATIDVEAKAKELAILKLRGELSS